MGRAFGGKPSPAIRPTERLVQEGWCRDTGVTDRQVCAPIAPRARSLEALDDPHQPHLCQREQSARAVRGSPFQDAVFVGYHEPGSSLRTPAPRSESLQMATGTAWRPPPRPSPSSRRRRLQASSAAPASPWRGPDRTMSFASQVRKPNSRCSPSTGSALVPRVPVQGRQRYRRRRTADGRRRARTSAAPWAGCRCTRRTR